MNRQLMITKNLQPMNLKSVRFGDVFDANRFERPFTVEDMTYLPYIDIFDFEMTSDLDWYYVDISMIGPDPVPWRPRHVWC